MGLYEHLMESRDKSEMAKELASKTREVLDLQDQISQLKHELFWKTETAHLKKQTDDAARYRRIRDSYHVQFKDGKFLNLSMIVSEEWGQAIDAEVDRLRGVT